MKPMNQQKNSGRIRLIPVAILLIAMGLGFNQWWWQLGVLILVVLLVQAYTRYVTLD